MPLYEYQCTACNERSEVLQRLGEAPIAVCPACGGPLKKLISSPAFQFKGSGWYATDYARKSGGSGGSDGGEGNASAGDSSSAGSATTGTAAGGGKSAEAKSDGAAGEKSDSQKASKAEPKATTGA